MLKPININMPISFVVAVDTIASKAIEATILIRIVRCNSEF